MQCSELISQGSPNLGNPPIQATRQYIGYSRNGSVTVLQDYGFSKEHQRLAYW
jgi:hypothetical protein